MGCGKSSVASLVASGMGCFYFDLDDTIEMEEDRSIADIFREEGETGFRALEFKYLERIFSDYEDFPTDMVISLGGGTVLNPECAQLLKSSARCVYLRASIDELVHNLEITEIENRPLLRGEDLRAEVSALLEKRSATYEKTADIILDIDGLSSQQIADAVISAAGE